MNSSFFKATLFVNICSRLVATSSAAAESETDLVPWLTKHSDRGVLEPYHTKLFHLDRADKGTLKLSSDGKTYAIVAATPHRHTVGIRQLGSPNETVLYRTNAPPSNEFGPLDVLWSPDGDMLFVKFGFVDMGRGRWFPAWPTNAITERHASELEALKQIQKANRPDYFFGTKGDGFEPVWTLGGKLFECELDASAAGFGNRLRPFGQSDSSSLGGIFLKWKDKDYRFLVSTIDGFEIFVFEGGRFLSKVKLAGPPLGRWLFLYIDGDLVAKTAWWETRPNASAQQRKGDSSVYDYQRLSVNLGKKHLMSAVEIHKFGALLETEDERGRTWSLLNLRELAARCLEARD